MPPRGPNQDFAAATEGVSPQKSIARIAIGYVVADGDLPWLARAIDRTRHALMAIGQGNAGSILVADDGAPVALRAWLPPDIAALPRRGAGGFLAAHARLMEAAFAQGADAYVLIETRSRIRNETLIEAMAALDVSGGASIVCAGALAPGHVPDPAHPAFLLIPRPVAERLGPFDERLDGQCGLIDFCLRARVSGVSVVSLRSNAVDDEADALRRPGRRALEAAWVLAGKWGSEPLMGQLRAIHVLCNLALPPVVACEYQDSDGLLTTWWERRVKAEYGCAPLKLSKRNQRAVMTPAELDASLAVPFPDACRIDGACLRIAAVVHLYYDELAETTYDTLKHIHVPCDLYITTDNTTKRASISRAFQQWTAGSIDVRVLPNSGRNVGPMLEVLHEVVDRYDLFLHLHGKKSVHCSHGVEWRNYMYETLCGSPAVVASVLSAFAASPRLGIVHPQHSEVVRPAISWGYNFEDAKDLAARVGIDLRLEQPLEFAAGFMFWARAAALKPLLAFDLSAGDFVEDAMGSSFAHAIERLLLRVCEHTGHTWLKIARADLAGRASPPPLAVETTADLRSQLARVTYLLSDPALSAPDHARLPWRFRPDDRDRPRLTLIAGAGWSPGLWQRWESAARALAPALESRVETLPPVGPGVQPPIDVRSHEVFVAADEACAQVALYLADFQQRFFGRSMRVQLLGPLIRREIRAALSDVGILDAGDVTSPRERTLA
jgi:hypothetical protein